MIRLCLFDADALTRKSFARPFRGTPDIAVMAKDDAEASIAVVDIDSSQLVAIEHIRFLRANRPALIRLVLASDENNPLILEALRAGAVGCLIKSSTPADLIAAIRHAFHGGSPLPLSTARQVLPLLQPIKEPAPQILALTASEERVLKLLAQNLHYKEIATHLLLSTSTVRAHLHSAYNKLNVNTRAEAVAKYLAKDPG